MSTKPDQFDVLDQMKDEGRISEEEYDDLKRGIVGDSAEAEPTEDPHPESESEDFSDEPDHAADESSDETSEPSARPRSGFSAPTVRTDLSTAYVLSILTASIVLFLAAALGYVSLLVSVVAVVGWAATLVEEGRLVTIGAGVLLGGMVIGGLFLGSGDSTPTGDPVVSFTAPEPRVAPEGSVGVFMDEVTDRWNTVDSAARINRGLTRNSESGEYDSFLYRFGDWGRLAGAYDPSDDAIYALLGTGQFSGPGTSTLYLHLCYVVHPFSQECIDAYLEEGLGYDDLSDYVGVDHQAEWTVDDQTWRLVIEGNVLTLRVLGPDVR